MKYVIFSIFSLGFLIINILLIDKNYQFITPIFTINPVYYKVISIMIYILISYIAFKFFSLNNYQASTIEIKTKAIIIINLLTYTIYNIFTFVLISPFIAFASKTFQFIASLHLNEEVVLQTKINAKLLVPYILWTFYLALSSISVFFLNNS